MPRMKKEAAEMTIAKQGDINIPVDGPARVEGGEIEIAEEMPSETKASEQRFLEEKVTIFLHESTNQQEEPLVFCAVNGIPAYPGNPYLKRGMNHTIARKHVAVLAKARKTSYTQPNKDSLHEPLVNLLRSHSAMKYPFSVVDDPSPRAATWLRQVMASA